MYVVLFIFLVALAAFCFFTYERIQQIKQTRYHIGLCDKCKRITQVRPVVDRDMLGMCDQFYLCKECEHKL